jgi:hypothetical protein
VAHNSLEKRMQIINVEQRFNSSLNRLNGKFKLGYDDKEEDLKEAGEEDENKQRSNF